MKAACAEPSLHHPSQWFGTADTARGAPTLPQATACSTSGLCLQTQDWEWEALKAINLHLCLAFYFQSCLKNIYLIFSSSTKPKSCDWLLSVETFLRWITSKTQSWNWAAALPCSLCCAVPSTIKVILQAWLGEPVLCIFLFGQDSRCHIPTRCRYMLL